MTIRVLRAQNEKEKKRTEKLLTAEFAKEARRSQRKEKNLGVKISHFPLLKQAVSLERNAQNYMHG